MTKMTSFSVRLKMISCFLCTAGGAEGGHWKGPRDGAEFWPLLWRNHSEYGSNAGFPRAAQADRKAGHWATVGPHLLAVLEVTRSHLREPPGRRRETGEQQWRFQRVEKGGTVVNCHWIFTCTLSSFVEEVNITTCCRDGLKFLTFLFVGVCLCGWFFFFVFWKFFVDLTALCKVIN